MSIHIASARAGCLSDVSVFGRYITILCRRERDADLDLAGGIGPGGEGLLVPYNRPVRGQR